MNVHIPRSPSRTPTPSITPSTSFSSTPSATSSISHTSTNTPTPSTTTSSSPTSSTTSTLTSTPTNSPTPSSTISASLTPSITSSTSFSNSPSNSPSNTPSNTPSNSNSPSNTPSNSPSSSPRAITVQLVKDFWVGLTGGYYRTYAVLNDTLIFTAYDSSTGYELWKMDKVNKTLVILVKDVYPGQFNGNPNYLTACMGAVFFAANDGSNGNEFWKSDGSATGSSMLKDIDNRSGGRSSDPDKFYCFNDKLIYFVANDATNGRELWVSDGMNTNLVKNIGTGVGDGYPSDFTAAKDFLFFVAWDPAGGLELHRTDGTAANTYMIKDINVGSGHSAPQYLTMYKDILYFQATSGAATNYELWCSDGSLGGTFMVVDINFGTGASNPVSLFVANFQSGSKLLFGANNGVTGNELWMFNGTDATLVKDINAGGTGSLATTPSFVMFNDFIYFAADSGSGSELWRSDGTGIGTTLVADLAATGGSNPKKFVVYTVFGNKLYFSAAGSSIEGNELWSTDGTGSGSKLIADINRNQYGSSNPEFFIVVGDALYFCATNGATGNELFVLY